ncbi:MAG: M48 family metalloprotease [Gammaproteobacteria bacterium]|nr:M48 family metalloprotease [Gammaproteobacteria bacterium]
MGEWRTDFAAAHAHLPWWPAKLLRPRLVFLPFWWPLSSNGAWAFLNVILVGYGLRNSPTYVRRYIIGHEYGHIQSNHTFLQLGILVALMGVELARIYQMPSVEGWSWLFLLIMGALVLWPPLERSRQYQADSVAASLYGQETARQGMLWMAYKTATFDKTRRKRLTRLGWQEQD